VLAAIFSAPLRFEPGARVLYSCPGFITLGHAITRLTGLPLDRAVRALVLEPLGADDACYCPAAAGVGEVVPTGAADYRQRRLRGEVHDPLASAMGGISGNAGLFASIDGVARLGQLYLDGGAVAGRVLLSEALARDAVREHIRYYGERRGLGWAVRPSGGGRLMAAQTYGHTGFTGTSLYVDPTRALVVVFLTNRVWGGDNTPMLTWRQQVHDGIIRALDAAA
jgi:CubicO group peptidase (beta-lactamase class C family)